MSKLARLALVVSLLTTALAVQVSPGSVGMPAAATPLRDSITVTGGQTSDSGGYRYHAFTTVGASTLAVSGGSIDVDVLVVAGGGSGGAGAAGGGGAGGVEWNFPAPDNEFDEEGAAAFVPLTISGIQDIEVGAGGASVNSSNAEGDYKVGKNGGESRFTARAGGTHFHEIVADGGGGGGIRGDRPHPNGLDGGSGGGGGRLRLSSSSGGEGTSTLGGDGASGISASIAGGGGGAGGDGGTTKPCGEQDDNRCNLHGGPGTPLFSEFLDPFTLGQQLSSGGERFIAGGGGALGGTGGVGGGGKSGSPGEPNSGGGGGALADFGNGSGAGGSGVVIVRYAIPVWQQDANLGAIRIGDPLDVGALVGDPADEVDATFELINGSLPSGLSIAGSADALTGTTSTAGTYTFTLRAFDRSSGAGVAVDRTFTVEVFDALIVDEPFDDAPGSEWVLTGGAPAGSSWTPQVVNATFDGRTRGALRVTPAAGDRSGFALYDVPQQTRAGLDITFWASVWQSGNTLGADGLAFFLKRGDDIGTTPGAFGSRAGYAGLSGALLGVGIDTFGGFMRHALNDLPAGSFTCPSHTDVNQTEGNLTGSPNNLSVRGPGQPAQPGQDRQGYCLLTEHVTISPGWGRTDSDPDGGTRTRQAGARQIRVRYDYFDGTPATGQIRVWVDDVADGDTPKITLDAPQELLDAETFKFGFSGATGGQFNNQEVWDVVVRSVEPLAPIAWTGEALEDGIVGETYTAALDAKAQGGVRPYTFSLAGGQLPPGMTLNSPLAGTPTQPGTYTFDVTATSSRGGTAATESFTLLIKDQQTLELTVPSQPLDLGSLTLAPVSRAQTSGSATDLPVAVTSTSPSTCTVSGTTVAFEAAGNCDLELTQVGGTSGGLTYAAADPVVTSFQIVDVDLRLAGLTLSSAALSPVFSPSTTTYQASVPNGVTSVRLTPTASDASATITVQGQTVLSGASSSPIPLSVGSNTIEVTVQNGAFERTTTIAVRRAGPAAPPAAEVTAPPLPPGPVLTAGAAPRPSPTPTARVGEREVTVVPTPAGTVRREGTTTVSTAAILEVGGVSLAVDVTGAGEVRTAAGAAPQISVARDSVARTSGGGLLPGTQIQAWLPLSGGNARPVVTLPVAEDGTFTGELPFDGRSDRQTDGRPLPIGTHVLQLVGVDAQGEVTVIEQTVRIEQPAPAPEPDRNAGAPPTLTPGASIATNAGVPEAVTVVPVPEVRQARVEGSGWTMAVDIPSADGRVAPAEGGGALIELVEEDVAQVSGDGFLPGTRADVWLFSTPTLLGTVTIGSDGTFSGEVPVNGIATGEHTLQLQGVGRDGYVRAANLGVVVVPRVTDEPAAEPEPEPEPAPEAAAAQPEDRVEVVTAAGQDTAGTSPLVWIALIAALGVAGWWFLIARRRRDDEAAHQG